MHGWLQKCQVHGPGVVTEVFVVGVKMAMSKSKFMFSRFTKFNYVPLNIIYSVVLQT